MDVPLHDVNTLVLCGLTKHPMEAPQEQTCSQRKWKLGR